MRLFTDSDEWRPPALRARDRDLGQRGQQTLRELLDAGFAEFCDKRFSAVRGEDVVLRTKTSHGTFYLRFESKEDLVATLLRMVLGMTAAQPKAPGPGTAGSGSPRTPNSPLSPA
ncbi:MAG TPA: helix-turn-helix domain-containing protein [Streptosporangiaceae bacterium]|nr:helix-turn-helix domain-containing protein [Streptosporangiaceae bacterium]